MYNLAVLDGVSHRQVIARVMPDSQETVGAGHREAGQVAITEIIRQVSGNGGSGTVPGGLRAAQCADVTSLQVLAGSGAAYTAR